MRILFRLRNAELSLPRGTDNISQNVSQFLRRKDKGRRISDIILGQGEIIDPRPRLSIETVEIPEKKSLGQLSGPIGAKVEKQNRIAIADSLLIWKAKDERRHKF